MKINICLATDENYLSFLTTTIASILFSADDADDLHFYVLANALTDFSKRKISSLGTIRDFHLKIIDADTSILRQLPQHDPHISQTTYTRYLIAKLVPDESKMLYLDCDIIVKKSLSALYATNLADNYIGAVEDVGYNFYRMFTPSYAIKGFYANAGVLLINLNLWRTHSLEQTLFEQTKLLRDKTPIGDQDIINLVCRGKILPLPYEYNAQDSFWRFPEPFYNAHRAQIRAAAKNPAVIHYTGARKPWNDATMPRAKDWWSVAIKTHPEHKSPSSLTIWKGTLSCRFLFILGWLSDLLRRRRPLMKRRAEWDATRWTQP